MNDLVRRLGASLLALMLLTICSPAAAQGNYESLPGAYSPRPGSTVSAMVGQAIDYMNDVGCEDNQIQGPLGPQGIPLYPTPRSPPAYMVGLFAHEGAWLDQISSTCKVAQPWGPWQIPDMPTVNRYYINGYGVRAQHVVENQNNIGMSKGGGFASVLCPPDSYVEGFDVYMAKEKASIARVQLTCINPQTGASVHVTEAGGPHLPNVGLTYEPSKTIFCPAGSLAAGFFGFVSPYGPFSGASLMTGNKPTEPTILGLGLICRPFKVQAPPVSISVGQIGGRNLQMLNQRQFIGIFAPNPGQPIWLYTVSRDGTLKESILPGGATSWLPANKVGSDWQQFDDILPGLGNQFFARTDDGYLKWYQHDGFRDGQWQWHGPVPVGHGYQEARFFSGGDNIIYAVNAGGQLVWRRPGAFQSGTEDNFFAGQRVIAPGFGDYKTLFSMGGGIIYAVTDDGKLMWFRHTGYLTGEPGVDGPVQVGTDWAQFSDIIPVGDGVILAIKPDGEMLRYRHNEYLSPRRPGTSLRMRMIGQPWDGPTSLGGGWTGYSKIFALLPMAQSTGSTIH